MLDNCINDSTFRIFNVYVPNSDVTDFFSLLNTLIQEECQDYNMIFGDLNITLEPEMDSFKYKDINNPLSCGPGHHEYI